MIGQYLPQTNESTTVPKTFQFSKLNKALVWGRWEIGGRHTSPAGVAAGGRCGGPRACLPRGRQSQPLLRAPAASRPTRQPLARRGPAAAAAPRCSVHGTATVAASGAACDTPPPPPSGSVTWGPGPTGTPSASPGRTRAAADVSRVSWFTGGGAGSGSAAEARPARDTCAWRGWQRATSVPGACHQWRMGRDGAAPARRPAVWSVRPLQFARNARRGGMPQDRRSLPTLVLAACSGGRPRLIPCLFRHF